MILGARFEDMNFGSASAPFYLIEYTYAHKYVYIYMCICIIIDEVYVIRAEYLGCLARLYTRRRSYEKARVAYDLFLRHSGTQDAVRQHITQHRTKGHWHDKVRT